MSDTRSYDSSTIEEMIDILAFIEDGTINDPEGSGGVVAMDSPYEMNGEWTTLGEAIVTVLTHIKGVNNDVPPSS